MSLIYIALATQAAVMVHYLNFAHQFMVDKLTYVFAGGQTGQFLKQALALILLPLAITAVPALIYYGVKRRSMPYFIHLLWAVWIALATSLAIGNYH